MSFPFPPGFGLDPEMIAQMQQPASGSDQEARPMVTDPEVLAAQAAAMAAVLPPDLLQQQQLHVAMAAQGLLPMANVADDLPPEDDSGQEDHRSKKRTREHRDRSAARSPNQRISEEVRHTVMMRGNTRFGDVYNPLPAIEKRPYPIPQSIAEGDWECPNQKCRNINFKKRSRCNMCNTHKNARFDDDEGVPSMGNRPGVMSDHPEHPSGIFKPGDWTCGSCGNINWIWRERCNVCSNLRTNLQDPRGGGKAGGYFDRSAVVKDRHDSDDEEIDEFGRRKSKRKRGAKVDARKEALDRLYKKKKSGSDEKLLREEEEEHDDGKVLAWMREAEEEENKDETPAWMKEAEQAEANEDDDDVPAWMKADQDERTSKETAAGGKTHQPTEECTLTSSERAEKL